MRNVDKRKSIIQGLSRDIT